MLGKSMITRNLKKWGYDSRDEELDDFLNHTLAAFVQRQVRNIQRGGKIVLPSEYFGVESGRYSVDAPAGSSLAVTDQFIREPLATADPTGAIVGGGKRFEVSKRAVDEAVGGSASKAERVAIKAKYEKTMTELMNSVSRKVKSDYLSKSAFENVLKMAKYSTLRS